MSKRFLCLLFMPLSLCLSSCHYIKGRFWLAMGNYNYARGNYIEAVSFYNKGLRYPDFKPWCYYNLGLSYAALSENESALDMWDKAKLLGEQNFLFYIHYNEGLVYYYQGFYSKSFNAFKKALQINPNDKSTKVNLELSLQKLHNSMGQKVMRTNQVQSSSTQITQKEEELLKSIRQMEGNKWIANTQHSDASSCLPDY